MVQNVIKSMEAVHARKGGKVVYVMNACAPIICMVKIVSTHVNVNEITPKFAIHSRENVTARLVGVTIYVIDLVHS